MENNGERTEAKKEQQKCNEKGHRVQYTTSSEPRRTNQIQWALIARDEILNIWEIIG